MKIGQPFNPKGLFYGIFLPEAIVASKDITPTAKLAYGHLCRRAFKTGRSFPSKRDISTHIGVGERQVIRALKELEVFRLIQIVHRSDASGRQTTNEYEFLWHSVLENHMPMAEGDTEVTLDAPIQSISNPVTLMSPRKMTRTSPLGVTRKSSLKGRTFKNQEKKSSSPLPRLAEQAGRKDDEDLILNAINQYSPAGRDLAEGLIAKCASIDPGITVTRVARLVHASVPKGRRLIESAGFFLVSVPKLVGTPQDQPDSPTSMRCVDCDNSGLLSEPDRFCPCRRGEESRESASLFTAEDWDAWTEEGNVNRNHYLAVKRALESEARELGNA